MAEAIERNLEQSPSTENLATLEKVETRQESQDVYQLAWDNTLSQPGLDLLYQNLKLPLENIRDAIFVDNKEEISKAVTSFEKNLDMQLSLLSTFTTETAKEHLYRTIDSLYGKQFEVLARKLEFFKSQRAIVEKLPDVPDFSWKCEQYINALTLRYTNLKKTIEKQPPTSIRELKKAYMTIVNSMLENNSAEFKDPASWVQILSEAIAKYETNEAEHTLDELQHA